MTATAEVIRPELVRPHERFRVSFLAAVREFQAEGRYTQYNLDRLAAEFPAFIRELHGYEDPTTLPTHLVPETLYWLVDGDDFIGRVSLRHELNEQLRLIGGHIGYEIRPSRRRRGYGHAALRLVLPHALARGLHRVLITCDATNDASRRIIEAQCGIPEEPYTPPGEAVPKLRYWIALRPGA